MGGNDEGGRSPVRLLSIPQVAELCGLSDRSINRAILDGELRGVKLRSRWRIHPDDLAEWVQSSVSDQPVAGQRPSPRAIHRHAPAHSLRRLFEEDQAS